MVVKCRYALNMTHGHREAPYPSQLAYFFSAFSSHPDSLPKQVCFKLHVGCSTLGVTAFFLPQCNSKINYNTTSWNLEVQIIYKSRLLFQFLTSPCVRSPQVRNFSLQFAGNLIYPFSFDFFLCVRSSLCSRERRRERRRRMRKEEMYRGQGHVTEVLSFVNPPIMDQIFRREYFSIGQTFQPGAGGPGS